VLSRAISLRSVPASVLYEVLNSLLSAGLKQCLFVGYCALCAEFSRGGGGGRWGRPSAPAVRAAPAGLSVTGLSSFVELLVTIPTTGDSLLAMYFRIPRLAGMLKTVLFFQRKADYAGSSRDSGGGSQVSRSSSAELSIEGS
jgi:hypothetical protein